MVNFLHVLAIIFAGVSVAFADTLLKGATLSGSFWDAIKNPRMITVLLLYLTQIVMLVYVFTHKWNLGIVGNLQVVFYSLTVVLSGLLFFGEKISPIRGIGIILSIVGVILMNSEGI